MYIHTRTHTLQCDKQDHTNIHQVSLNGTLMGFSQQNGYISSCLNGYREYAYVAYV